MHKKLQFQTLSGTSSQHSCHRLGTCWAFRASLHQRYCWRNFKPNSRLNNPNMNLLNSEFIRYFMRRNTLWSWKSDRLNSGKLCLRSTVGRAHCTKHFLFAETASGCSNSWPLIPWEAKREVRNTVYSIAGGALSWSFLKSVSKPSSLSLESSLNLTVRNRQQRP